MSLYYTKQAIRKKLEDAEHRDKIEMRNEIRAVDAEEAVQMVKLVQYSFITLSAFFSYFLRKAADRHLCELYGKP